MSRKGECRETLEEELDTVMIDNHIVAGLTLSLDKPIHMQPTYCLPIHYGPLILQGKQHLKTGASIRP